MVQRVFPVIDRKNLPMRQ